MKVLVLIFVAIFATRNGCEGVEQVPIGLSVWDSYSDVFTAMQYALEKHTNDTSKLFQFKVYADRIRTIDAYKVKFDMKYMIFCPLLVNLFHLKVFIFRFLPFLIIFLIIAVNFL